MASVDRPESRMDLILHAPAQDSPVHIDLTIVSPVSREALARGSADREGTAAMMAASRKRAKYPLIAVLPFVIEEGGRLGEDALGFVRKLAPREPKKRVEALNSLNHALGATLQRTAANAITAAIVPRSWGAIARGGA